MALEPSKKEKDDLKVLARFLEIFCRVKHDAEKVPFTLKAPDVEDLGKRPVSLCHYCTRLLRYGVAMRLRCPYDPKPMCKNCPNPCYRLEYRSKIREVMRFSGMYLVKRGRIDLLYHYFR